MVIFFSREGNEGRESKPQPKGGLMEANQENKLGDSQMIMRYMNFSGITDCLKLVKLQAVSLLASLH